MGKKKDQLFAASELVLLILAGATACGLGVVLDLASMLISYRGRSLHSDLRKVLEPIGGSFSGVTLSKTLDILEERELIERVSGGWRISKKGKERILPKLPERMKGTWDGKWRVVVFDIEETNRKIRYLVRSHLKALGCGMMQYSVWISPYNIDKFLLELKTDFNLGNGLRWFTCTEIDDEKDLVNRCWDLKTLNFEYAKLLRDGDNLPTQNSISNFISFKIWEKKYLKLLEEDPLLPEHLLPVDWKGTNAAHLHLMLASRFQNSPQV